MQIEPRLSWVGSDSIWIYWFNQLSFLNNLHPYRHTFWDLVHATKIKTRESKMRNLPRCGKTPIHIPQKNKTPHYQQPKDSPSFEDNTLWYKSFGIQIFWFLIAAFPKNGYQTGQQSSRNGNLPLLLGWNQIWLNTTLLRSVIWVSYWLREVDCMCLYMYIPASICTATMSLTLLW